MGLTLHANYCCATDTGLNNFIVRSGSGIAPRGRYGAHESPTALTV